MSSRAGSMSNSKSNYEEGDASDLMDWSNKFFKKRKAKGIPPNRKGHCHVCKLESTLRCKKCLVISEIDGRRAPFYCGPDHQLVHWKSGHKKACHSGPQSVFGLAYSVHKNFLPGIGAPEYNDYGFGNCKTMEEEKNLMGLYIGLIERIECDLDDLHEACRNGRLGKFIIAEFEEKIKDPTKRGGYYPWFLANQHVVKNIVPVKIM